MSSNAPEETEPDAPNLDALIQLLRQSQQSLGDVRGSGERLQTRLQGLLHEITQTKTEMDKAKADLAKTMEAMEAARRNPEAAHDSKDEDTPEDQPNESTSKSHEDKSG